MIKRFYELQEKVLSYYSEANIELLKKAYAISTDAHMNQKRASNEPYIIHPLAVASILADMRLDEISIASGLLHDVLEDSSYTHDDLNHLFGREISDIVWGVTKITKISNVDVENAQAETLKKMIIAMTTDVRVILIKLADRLHNIRTLHHLPQEKRIKVARETLEIYAPIAYRLGMGKIRDELEDFAFQYLHPDEYLRIKAEVSDKHDWMIAQLETMQQEIRDLLSAYRISAEIHYRIKREISIFRKLQRQSIELDKVYDLMALRIITDSVANCYAIMGIIHQKWTHIPARWRDFIANHKSNFYQSIHTTIITREGLKFEVQIRTREMHQNAEEGISAHWKYKEGLRFIENDNRLQWFREMIDYHKANPDPKEFLSLIKKDLTPNEIYVFTPKGKVVNLKAGSTPLDFAYAIHSEVGDHCKSAVVNEKMVPLRTVLNSGDVVEILTSKNSVPSSDWLKIAVSTRAKRKIVSFIQRRETLQDIEKGKRLWQHIIREYQKKHPDILDESGFLNRIAKLHYTDADTFYRDLGAGKKVLNSQNLKTLFPEMGTLVPIAVAEKNKRKVPSQSRLISVEGQQDIDFQFARCCSPIKGDEIIGYMTKNRGLIIHKKNCTSINQVIPSRLKQVSWNLDEIHLYGVRFELTITDRPGMLSAITTITAESGSNIRKLEMDQVSQSMSKVKLVFEVVDVKQLEKIFLKLKSINGVQSIIRRKIG